MDNNLSPNIPPIKYICTHCDYNTCNKKDYNKHISTRKHLRIIKCPKLSPEQYSCECGKIYKYRSGLCKHKHNCLYKSMDTAQDNTVNLEFLTLCKAQMDENKNLSNVILDVIMIINPLASCILPVVSLIIPVHISSIIRSLTLS